MGVDGYPYVVAHALVKALDGNERVLFLRPNYLVTAIPPCPPRSPIPHPRTAHDAAVERSVLRSSPRSGKKKSSPSPLLEEEEEAAAADTPGGRHGRMSSTPVPSVLSLALSEVVGPVTAARKALGVAHRDACPATCIMTPLSTRTVAPLIAALVQRQLGGHALEHALAAALIMDGLNIVACVVDPVVCLSVAIEPSKGVMCRVALPPFSRRLWTRLDGYVALINAPVSALSDALGDEPELASWLDETAAAGHAHVWGSSTMPPHGSTPSSRKQPRLWVAFLAALRRFVPREDDIKSVLRAMAASILAIDIRLIDDSYVRPATPRDAAGLRLLAKLLGHSVPQPPPASVRVTVASEAPSHRRQPSTSRDGGVEGDESLSIDQFLEMLKTAPDPGAPGLRRICFVVDEIQAFLGNWLLDTLNARLAAVRVGPDVTPNVVVCTFCRPAHADRLGSNGLDSDGNGYPPDLVRVGGGLVGVNPSADDAVSTWFLPSNVAYDHAIAWAANDLGLADLERRARVVLPLLMLRLAGTSHPDDKWPSSHSTHAQPTSGGGLSSLPVASQRLLSRQRQGGRGGAGEGNFASSRPEEDDSGSRLLGDEEGAAHNEATDEPSRLTFAQCVDRSALAALLLRGCRSAEWIGLMEQWNKQQQRLLVSAKSELNESASSGGKPLPGLMRPNLAAAAVVEPLTIGPSTAVQHLGLGRQLYFEEFPLLCSSAATGANIRNVADATTQHPRGGKLQKGPTSISSTATVTPDGLRGFMSAALSNAGRRWGGAQDTAAGGWRANSTSTRQIGCVDGAPPLPSVTFTEEDLIAQRARDLPIAIAAVFAPALASQRPVFVHAVASPPPRAALSKEAATSNATYMTHSIAQSLEMSLVTEILTRDAMPRTIVEMLYEDFCAKYFPFIRDPEVLEQMKKRQAAIVDDAGFVSMVCDVLDLPEKSYTIDNDGKIRLAALAVRRLSEIEESDRSAKHFLKREENVRKVVAAAAAKIAADDLRPWAAEVSSRHAQPSQQQRSQTSLRAAGGGIPTMPTTPLAPTSPPLDGDDRIGSDRSHSHGAAAAIPHWLMPNATLPQFVRLNHAAALRMASSSSSSAHGSTSAVQQKASAGQPSRQPHVAAFRPELAQRPAGNPIAATGGRTDNGRPFLVGEFRKLVSSCLRGEDDHVGATAAGPPPSRRHSDAPNAVASPHAEDPRRPPPQAPSAVLVRSAAAYALLGRSTTGGGFYDERQEYE